MSWAELESHGVAFNEGTILNHLVESEQELLVVRALILGVDETPDSLSGGSFPILESGDGVSDHVSVLGLWHCDVVNV